MSLTPLLTQVLIILGILALLRLNQVLGKYIAKSNQEVLIMKRLYSLQLKMDKLAIKHDKLIPDYKLYNDLGNTEKAEEIRQQCIAYRDQYNQIRERLIISK